MRNSVRASLRHAVRVALAAAALVLSQTAFPFDSGALAQKVEVAQRSDGNGVFALTDLIVEVLQEGDGPQSNVGQTLVVDFTSWVMEGGQPSRVYDSAQARGGPWSFVLGANQAIQGWDRGLRGAKVGSRLRLTVPPQMAYGDRGFSGPSAFVPPGAWVMSEVTILEVR